MLFRSSLILFILYTPFLSILMTWVFKHIGGSVLIAVLIHYMANICTTIIGVTLPTLGVIWLAICILLLTLDKQFGWFRKGAARWIQIPSFP